MLALCPPDWRQVTHQFKAPRASPSSLSLSLATLASGCKLTAPSKWPAANRRPAILLPRSPFAFSARSPGLPANMREQASERARTLRASPLIQHFPRRRLNQLALQFACRAFCRPSNSAGASSRPPTAIGRVESKLANSAEEKINPPLY